MEVIVVLGQMMVVTVIISVVAVVGAVVITITITAWPASWILTRLHSQCSCSQRFRCTICACCGYQCNCSLGVFQRNCCLFVCWCVINVQS